MKKMMMIVLSLLVLISVAACQATPDKDIVVGKHLDEMIEKAAQPNNTANTQAGTASTQDNTASTQVQLLAEKLGAPQSYQTDLVDANGKVSIHVDANVQIPSVGSVSVQRVERGRFAQAQVDTLVSQLMSGDMFSGFEYKLTKSDIQQQIVAIEAAQQSGSSKEKKPGSFDARLTNLKELLAAAPDTSTKVPIDGKLQPMEPNVDYTTGEKLYALSETAQGNRDSLRVYSYDQDAVDFIRFTSEKNGFSQEMGDFSTVDAITKDESLGMTPTVSSAELAAIPQVTISVDDAKAKAEALIAALGINGMQCYSADIMYGGSGDRTPDQASYINPRKCVWFLRYERSVSGVAVTYTPWDCMKTDENAQAAPWSYEDMTFAIDDSGIVGFDWESPYIAADIVTENSNLISFHDVTSVFGTMALAVNAWDGLAAGNPTLKSVEINVDHIQFGLTRITEENKRDSGLLVPVWDFFGTMTYVMDKDGKTRNYYDSNIPILTVNAIDGSVINRSLGY